MQRGLECDETPDNPARQRRSLMDVSYRMLGSIVEAEDAVQETYARWLALSEAQRAQIERPTAWLVRVASRICLDVLGSARSRREHYVGEWLPEPVPGDGRWTSHGAGAHADDPAALITVDDSVRMAMLVVLDTMTPAERVAFVLHDVFAFSFAEVGEVLDRSPAASRQLAASARRRVRHADADADGAASCAASGGRAARTAQDSRSAGVVDAFRTAWETGDLAALLDVLDPGATVVSDGGGKVAAELLPVVGADAVAAFFVRVREQATGLELQVRGINGEPGIIASLDGQVVTVMTFQVVEGRLLRLWALRNPDKLRLWTHV